MSAEDGFMLNGSEMVFERWQSWRFLICFYFFPLSALLPLFQFQLFILHFTYTFGRLSHLSIMYSTNMIMVMNCDPLLDKSEGSL